LGEKVGGRVVAARAVFAREVEEVLVGGGGGEEVGRIAEGLEVEELRFDGGVAAFDVGVGVGVCRRIEPVGGADRGKSAVKTVVAVVHCVTVELGAEVGAHDQLREIKAVSLEVRGDARGGEGGVGFRQFAGVGEKEGAEGFAADGVLEPGHAGLLHLGKVMRDVVEILGIHLEAQERRMRGLDGPQVGFALMLARTRADELCVAQDAMRRALAERQFEHVHEAPRAETGGLFARGDDLGRDGLSGPRRRVLGAAREVRQGIIAGFPAAVPEAHGGAGAFVAPSGGAMTVGFGVAHNFVAQRELVLADFVHGAIESEPGVGLSLHTSASPREAPDSLFFFPDEGPDGQAPSSLPVWAFICCFSHLTPRFPNTRSSIIAGFRLPGSGCL